MPHWHHHDTHPCTDDHEWPDWALTILATLDHLGDTMTSAQQHLDTDVAALHDAIAAEVEALKEQDAAKDVDFTGLDNLVAQVKAAIPAPLPTAIDIVPTVQTVEPTGPVVVPVTAATVPSVAAPNTDQPAPQVAAGEVANPTPADGDTVVAGGTPAVVTSDEVDPAVPAADAAPVADAPSSGTVPVTVTVDAPSQDPSVQVGAEADAPAQAPGAHEAPEA